MTALEGLDRLEAPATWHPGGGEPPREVYLAIGKASLLIQSPDGEALAHWSLPAIRRDGSDLPAIYRPGRGAEETVEIAEVAMVDALERVRLAVERGRGGRGRLRAGMVVAVALVAGIAGAAFLPDALREHTVRTLPLQVREDLGDRLLDRVVTLTGPPCDAPLGLEALALLKGRVLPSLPVRIRVVRDLPMPALALPGGTLLLSEAVIADAAGPAVPAGHLVAAGLEIRDRAPLGRLAEDVPPATLVRLLATAELPEEELDAHLRRLLLRPPPLPEADRLREALGTAAVEWAPFAAAAGLPPGPPTEAPPPPVLDAATWARLKSICR